MKELKQLFEKIGKANRRKLEKLILLLIITGALIFRLYEYEKRTFWNVDQSLLFWQIKSIVIDRNISLIGLHFFSLLNGAVYRSAIFNWLLAIPAMIFGLRVKLFIFIYAILAIGSLLFSSQVAKKFGGTMAWKFALILYGFSWFINRKEMVLWYAAPMIVLSSCLLWWIFGRKSNNVLKDNFILGIILGLGFSLHFVVIWMIGGVALYWLIMDRYKLSRKIFGLIIGLAIMLMPLLIFNARHDFIMKQGLINMVTGAAVEDQASFQDRFSKANREITSLVTGVAGLKSRTLFALTSIVLISLISFRSFDSKKKNFLIFSIIQFVIAYIGLIYAGRMDYSSQHYVHYLIPILVIIFSLALTELVKIRFGIISIGLIVIYLYTNLFSFVTFNKNGSYFNKKKLAEYIYSLPSTDRIGIKFWDQETLAYDFVFYETSRKFGIPYEKINLIERWGSDKEDGYVYLHEKPAKEGEIVKFGENKLLMLTK